MSQKKEQFNEKILLLGTKVMNPSLQVKLRGTSFIKNSK